MSFTPSATADERSGISAKARAFVRWHESEIRPLEIRVASLWWNANVSGKDEDFQKKQDAETALDVKLSDRAKFAELKAIREAGVPDPILAREIEMLYLQYLPRQLDAELLKAILDKSNAIEKTFTNERPHVNGKELTSNDVKRILGHSTDSAERKAAWEASKEVGKVTAADLKRLVKLRNEAARRLGFKDYHVMQLALNEQNQDDVLKLFDELDRLTRKPFREAKAEIDAVLAKNCGIAVKDLRPWHYHDPFCQESPDIFGKEFSDVFDKVDIVKTCRDFYAGIGLPVDDVLKRSDLYEAKGKNPHAFCTDIDRAGDVRILCNIVPGDDWLSTTLHELGHSVYSSKNMPESVPYVLRQASQSLTTEGIAMMFERFCGNAAWLKALGTDVPDPKAFQAMADKSRRNRLLLFSRWCQVMLRFEKAMYADPDQDLNKLWWDLVEEYQEVKRPEGRDAPDYAAKMHILNAPAYYHNYMMGELFAAQVHAALVREVLGPSVDPAHAIYVGNKAAGRFLREKVFAPGAILPWNELTREATGKELNPRDFAKQIEAAR